MIIIFIFWFKTLAKVVIRKCFKFKYNNTVIVFIFHFKGWLLFLYQYFFPSAFQICFAFEFAKLFTFSIYFLEDTLKLLAERNRITKKEFLYSPLDYCSYHDTLLSKLVVKSWCMWQSKQSKCWCCSSLKKCITVLQIAIFIV